MMKRLRDIGLAGRIYSLSVAMILIFLLVIGWLFFQFRESLYDARRQEMKSLVESAWHILEFHAGLVSHDSRDEARQRAFEIIRNQRFDDGNYFWISDLAPVMVMHPMQPQLESWESTNALDISARAILTEMADLVEHSGEGFVGYRWPKPGEIEAVEKISFVKMFSPWGLMIGAGFYVDDIDRYLARLMLVAGIVLLGVTAAALALATWVSRSISVPARRAVSMIEALERGDLGRRLRLDRQDEIGRLGRAMDAFADSLQYEILTAFERLARGDFTFVANGLIREPLAKTNARLNTLVENLDDSIRQEQQERAKLEALMAAIGDGIAIYNSELECIYQNRAHLDLTGPLVGKPCADAFDDTEHSCADCALHRALTSGGVHRMERQIGAGDRGIYIEITASAVRNATGDVVAVIEIARDITDRKKSEAHIHHLAFHDPLTGLPNRALLEDRLRMALAHARRSKGTGALFFIDLDRFKTINDTLGHHVGDHLLKEAGQRIKAIVRATDTVCRFGGDEFILLLPEVDGSAGAARLAGRILAAFRRPFVIHAQELTTSVSIGITLFPDDGTDFQDLLRNADAGMYQAKKEGRNTFHFFRSEQFLKSFSQEAS